MKGTLKIALALAAVALMGGGWYWLDSRNGDGQVRYRTAKVERGALSAVVVASGTLNATTTVQVGSQISGQVQRVLVDFNDTVRRGQVLAVIEVKTRGQYADAAASILPAQQARIARATEWLLAQRPDLAALTIRFDAVLVQPRRWPTHLVDAYSQG